MVWGVPRKVDNFADDDGDQMSAVDCERTNPIRDNIEVAVLLDASVIGMDMVNVRCMMQFAE